MVNKENKMFDEDRGTDLYYIKTINHLRDQLVRIIALCGEGVAELGPIHVKEILAIVRRITRDSLAESCGDEGELIPNIDAVECMDNYSAQNMDADEWMNNVRDWASGHPQLTTDVKIDWAPDSIDPPQITDVEIDINSIREKIRSGEVGPPASWRESMDDPFEARDRDKVKLAFEALSGDLSQDNVSQAKDILKSILR